MYWDQVLAEVLRKDQPQQNYLVTSVNEYTTATSKAKTTAQKKPARIKRQKFYLGPSLPDVYFTLREMQTIEQIIAGNNVTQTALILGMSPRTVEYYLRNMRNKLNCRHRWDLIDKVRDCGRKITIKVEP